MYRLEGCYTETCMLAEDRRHIIPRYLGSSSQLSIEDHAGSIRVA